jgi:hypothetical protein
MGDPNIHHNLVSSSVDGKRILDRKGDETRLK